MHMSSNREEQPALIINRGSVMYRGVFESLAKNFDRSNRAIIYDQRVIGRSKLAQIDTSAFILDEMVNDIEIMRNPLNLKNWIVLRQYCDGMLGSYYASMFPKKIKGPVLSSLLGISMDVLPIIVRRKTQGNPTFNRLVYPYIGMIGFDFSRKGNFKNKKTAQVAVKIFQIQFKRFSKNVTIVHGRISQMLYFKNIDKY